MFKLLSDGERDRVPTKTWGVIGTLEVRTIERFPAGWDLVCADGGRLRLWDGDDGPAPIPEWADA